MVVCKVKWSALFAKNVCRVVTDAKYCGQHCLQKDQFVVSLQSISGDVLQSVTLQNQVQHHDVLQCVTT